MNATKPGKKRAAPNTDKCVLYVNTTPSLKREFKAACDIEGKTIQETINEFMARYVARVGIRPASTS